MWALIRLDKIGDLICTLPVDQLIPEKQNRLWIIYDDLKPLLENRIETTEFTYRTVKRHQPWKEQFKEIQNILIENKVTHLILYYGPWWIGLAAVKAKVRFRFTRYFKPWTYLFFNFGLRQSRSKSEKHELEYNLELTKEALRSSEIDFKELDASDCNLKLSIHPPRRLFERFDIKNKQYMVIHPSMAGSALNWSQKNWSGLINECLKDFKVVITGTSADEKFLAELIIDKSHPNLIWTINQLSFYDLLGILQSAKVTIAPSTGVLHLSRVTNTNSIGIYPPILSQHPRRWKAIGADILLPTVNCPATKTCLLDKCSNYPCMELISVNDVVAKAKEMMNLV